MGHNSSSLPASNNQKQIPLQINSIPDELLFSIFSELDAFQRCLLLSICKRWNHNLLSNQSFWSSLILPPRRFNETLQILRIFNARSGYKLKHVVLGVKIRDSKKLDSIFRELKRSGQSLKVLDLCHQEGLGKKMRVLARDWLPNLNTLGGTSRGPADADFAGWNSTIWDTREDLQIKDEDIGIRICDLQEFGEFEAEDTEWLRNAKYLSLEDTGPIEDLILILKAAQSSLVKLDLQRLSVAGLTDLHPEVSLSERAGTVNLVELVELSLPDYGPEVESLRRLITIGNPNRLFLRGHVTGLVAFDLAGVKKVEIQMDSNSKIFLETLELTDLFVEGYESVEELILDCSVMQQIGYLNYLLHKLLPQDSSDHQSIPLPNLVRILIEDPTQLDFDRVEKVIESRRSIAPSFELSWGKGTDEEGLVEIEDWSERNWTK